MFLIYNFVLNALFPIWVPWMWLRARRRKEAPNWKHRFGNVTASVPSKKPGDVRLWLHAVSVGEVNAAVPILREVRKSLPEGATITLSVTTSTGYQTAEANAKGLYDYLIYMPIDVLRFQLQAVQRVRPTVLAIMETELWMNLLWASDVFEVNTMVLNGRISDRAFRRSQNPILKSYYRTLFGWMGQVFAQTDADAERFRALGAKEVSVLGNSKFDELAVAPKKSVTEWRAELGITDQKVVVVGSTRGEIEGPLVIEALAAVKQPIKIIHAPRHIEGVAELRKIAETTFRSVGQRSLGEQADYLFLDTYGELGEVYSVADVVIIGGGFDSLGGQNLIQPMALGKPVIHGPNMHNFKQVAATAKEAGATLTASTQAEITAAVEQLLADEPLRTNMGTAGKNLIEANLGASARYAAAILDKLNAK